MNALILHSFRRCPFAIRVRMVLEEKKIPFQIKEEDLSQPSTELLARHPEGRVPLLVHQINGKTHVIYQSTIITEYLEETFPQYSLMPSLPLLRTEVRLWTYWCDSIFKPDLDLFKYDFRSLNDSEKEDLKRRIHKNLYHWNQALDQRPFLLGDALTLADIHLFPFARQFFAIRPGLEEVDQYQNLQNWLTRMISRPAFERVMRKA